MKGYIVSFSAILLLSSMLLFSVFYSDNVKQRDMNLKEIKKFSKLGFVKDDLSFDLNKMLETEITIENQETLKLTFKERIPADFNKMQRIIKQKEFIESSYSAINNAEIKMNIARLQQNIPIKFSNGLIYEYGFKAGKNSVFFYALKDTLMTSMDLNLNVEGSSVFVSKPLNALNPDLTVNFNYADGNALNEKHEVLQLNSSLENKIEIRFSDDKDNAIKIKIGAFDGKNRAVKIENKTFNQNKISLLFKPVMPAVDLNSSIKVFVDIGLNYNQTDLNSNALIELKQV